MYCAVTNYLLVNFTCAAQLFIFQLASDGINKHVTQSLLDQAKYKSEIKDGADLVTQVKHELGEYFQNKIRAAEVCLVLWKICTIVKQNTS